MATPALWSRDAEFSRLKFWAGNGRPKVVINDGHFHSHGAATLMQWQEEFRHDDDASSSSSSSSTLPLPSCF